MLKKLSRSTKNKITFAAAITMIALVLTAVILLMNYVQTLLFEDVKINLNEIATQNKEVIQSRLELELNNIDILAASFSEKLTAKALEDDGVFKKIISDYISSKNDRSTFLARASDGLAFFADDKQENIKLRAYFLLAKDGTKNVSTLVTSRVDGKDYFTMSVPIYLDGNVVATAHKFYTPEQMYSLCELSLFSDQGFMYIVNVSGNVVVKSKNIEINDSESNFFRILNYHSNYKESEQLAKDIADEREGFMEIALSGVRYFSAYTPIENIHDWYLISSIAVSAVSPNSNKVIKMFYFILLFVVVIASVCLVLFLFYKNRKQQDIEKIAFVDEVTGGNTYGKFLYDAAKMLSEHRQYYMLVFDIDNFKYINSFYGFKSGDEMLKSIYKQVSGGLDKNETMARTSADHFVAILEDVSEKRIEELLDFNQLNSEAELYISSGIYKIKDSSEPINLMIDKAGIASQSVKNLLHGKTAFYSEEYDELIKRNERVKRQIERALAKNEIIAFYQPKIDVESGILVGAEALARWKTPRGEMVSPADFIPVCEITGQITNVDLAIFKQTLEFLKRNIDAGVKCVPVSVNFSRLHLKNDDFIHNITEMINQYKVPSEFIQIELTESIIFENHGEMSDFVNHLHEHGLLICIDDFGSGYSSLNMLKDLPVDVLKIDKAFLDDTSDSERQKLILSSIAQMAEKLEMDVVMEGVETRDNVELMKKIGLRVAQGYYYAKPMDEASFNLLFEKGKI